MVIRSDKFTWTIPSPHGRPLVIAHRGAAFEAPENTRVAVERAIPHRVIVEIDIQLSSDKELVVIHDKRVDRTTNGKGFVNQLTLRQLQNLDAGYYFTRDDGVTFPFRGKGVVIPTLDELLGAFPDQAFLIELKDSTAEAARRLHELIAKHNAFERVVVIVISAGHRAGLRLRKMDARLKVGHTSREIALFVALSKLRLGGLFRPKGVSFEIPMRKYRFSLPTRSFIKQAHRKGIAVFVWTINDPAIMRKCIALGVNGIMTDAPATLNGIIAEQFGN